VIRGVNLGQEITECSQLSYTNARVPFAVSSCSHYLDQNRPNLREMEEIAWVLRSDARRKRVGFVRSDTLPEDERFVLDD
jgi:hypothetical protein